MRLWLATLKLVHFYEMFSPWGRPGTRQIFLRYFLIALTSFIVTIFANVSDHIPKDKTWTTFFFHLRMANIVLVVNVNGQFPILRFVLRHKPQRVTATFHLKR